MTVSHPLMAVGYTQASNVSAPARSKLFASAIVTRAFVPLNDRALPYFPAVVQVAFVMVPLFPFPDVSARVVPVPASKLYVATRVLAVDTVSPTPAPGVSRFPLSSTARDLRVTAPPAIGIQV